MTAPLHSAVAGISPAGRLFMTMASAVFAVSLLWLNDWQLLSVGAYLIVALIFFGAIVTPSRWAALLFLVFIVLSHQYKSPFTMVALGIEWHPRDLALGALLLNGGVTCFRKLPLFPMEARWPTFAILLYGAFFPYAAAVGVLMGNELSLIRGELRYPIYLLSFFPLLMAIRTRDDLFFFFKGMACATAVIAIGAWAFFVYTEWTNTLVVNVQNSLGEFVRRDFGGHLIQSVRPSGHAFLEVALIVVVSLMFGMRLGRQGRMIGALAMIVLACAIAITMMRTAYLAVVLGLLTLLWLQLPKPWRVVSGVAAVFSGAAVLVVIWLYLGASGAAVELEVSLRARFVEMAGAWDLFVANLLVGSGLGSIFRAPGLVAPHTLLSVREVDYQTVHNAWMYFLYKGGLVGVTLVAAGLGILLWQAMRAADSLKPALDRALLRGIIAAFVGQCFASLTMPRITYPEGTVMLSLMVVIVVVYRGYAAKAQSESIGTLDERA